jgi:O-antigen/teichoic acid export membrane protein
MRVGFNGVDGFHHHVGVVDVDTLASGTFYLTLMQVLNYAVVFVFYVLAARILSPSEVGSFSLLLMAMSVFNTVTLLALNNAVIKYVSENLGRGDVDTASASSRKAFKLIIYTSSPALAVGFMISPTLSQYIGVGVPEVLSILSSAFILNLTSYYGAVMFGCSMFREVSLQNIIYTSLSRILGVLLAYLGCRVLGLSLGFLIGSAVTLIYSIIVLRGRLKPSGGGYPSIKLLKFSLPIYGGNIIGLVQGWLDIALLSSLAGLGSTGTYYIAVSSIAPLTILWTPLSSALFPTLSLINGRGSVGEVRLILERALNIATAVILPLSIALASVPQTALSIAYGGGYAEASIPFSILSSLAVVNAYTSIYSVGLQSVSVTKPIFKAGVASTIAYTVLLPSLTIPLRQVGAALARASMAIVGFTILRRELKVGAPRSLKRSIVASSIIAATLTPIEICLKANIYVKALIEALTFIAALTAVYKLIKPLSSEEVELIKTIIPLRRGRIRYQDAKQLNFKPRKSIQ